MGEILLYYKRPDPTTWVYLSSFLTIGLYFVFHRFWSVRNLDIVLLILLAPGLLMFHEGNRRLLIENEQSAREHAEQLDSRDGTEILASSPSTTDGLRSAQTTGELSVSGEPPGASDVASFPADGSLRPRVSGSSAGGEATGAAVDTEPRGSEEAEFEPPPRSSRYAPKDIQRWGFLYLFAIEAILLVRLMLDPLMVRRPLLDPNLTTGGLVFIGISLFVFTMANVVASTPRIQVTQGPALGPGYALMNMLPAIPTRPVSESPGGSSPPTSEELTRSQARLANIAKALAILGQLAIVSGIVLIGNRHFSNLRAGVGCATLYLMMPYTAQMTGRVDHAIPAALLLWAVLSYRRPIIAGMFLGLAGGLVYYPLFLLPLWFSFYWQRGARSLAIGVVTMLAVLMLALSVDGTASLPEHLQRMFGLLNPNRDASELRGFWALGWNPIWRLPVIVAFVILSVFFAIWPNQKNLGTLMSGTAALMVAAQFWHGYGGGLYIAWFLPLLLLTIFRPNLQDRVATKVVSTRADSGSRTPGFAAGV